MRQALVLFGMALALLLCSGLAYAFSQNSEISIEFEELYYPYTGATRVVEATVTVQESGGLTGEVTVTGPGTITPSTFTLPENGSYSKTIQVTLPKDAGEYTYIAASGRVNGTEMRDSEKVWVIQVDTLQHRIGEGAFKSIPNPLYVACGITVTFRALKNPAEAPQWPTSKPVWGGTAGVSGTGETKTVTFNTPGSFTVTVECGNTYTANLKVVEISKLQYSFGGGVLKDVPDPLYVFKGEEITFKSIPNPSGGWPVGKPIWGGTAGATGIGETNAVTFNTAGDCTVTAECGNTVTANISVVDDTTPPDLFEIALFGDAVIPFVIDPYWADIAFIGFRAQDDNEEIFDMVEVTLEIKSGETVLRTLCYEEWFYTGVEYWTTWDGTDEDGLIVDDGDYEVVITVRDFCGNETVGNATIGIWEW